MIRSINNLYITGVRIVLSCNAVMISRRFPGCCDAECAGLNRYAAYMETPKISVENQRTRHWTGVGSDVGIGNADIH